MKKNRVRKNMLQKGFEFYYKEKSGASRIKSSTENLTSMVYESFILELYFGTFYFGISTALLFSGQKNKTRIPSNHLFQRVQEHDG